MVLRPDSRLGTDVALSESLASRPVSSCVCESVCPGNVADYGRLDLSYHNADVPSISASRIWTGRPRSEKHFKSGVQRNASTSRLRLDERLLRVRVSQCLPRRTLSRRLSAWAHHV